MFIKNVFKTYTERLFLFPYRIREKLNSHPRSYLPEHCTRHSHTAGLMDTSIARAENRVDYVNPSFADNQSLGVFPENRVARTPATWRIVKKDAVPGGGETRAASPPRGPPVGSAPRPAPPAKNSRPGRYVTRPAAAFRHLTSTNQRSRITGARPTDRYLSRPRLVRMPLTHRRGGVHLVDE